jgi:Carbohydrate esterase, sialic acid-specific acetylesterase
MGRSRALAAALFLIGSLGLGCGLDEIPRGGVPPAPGPAPAPAPETPPPGMQPMGTPAPAVEPGLEISGRRVPRSKALVFLHVGHSNMAGRATRPAELRPHFYDTDPRLWSYGAAGFAAAKEPTAPDNQNGQAAGPGMALLRAALAAAPPDAVVVSIGHGHSGSYGGVCSAFRRGGLLYEIAMKPARELAGKVTFAGILTMLGQSEHRLTRAEQGTFSDCLDGIARDMRADLNAPELPFLVGGYEAGISRSDIHPTSEFGRLIITQIQMVPGKTPRSAVIPTDGLSMQDTHHFDMAGHKGWAERAVQILIDRGWAPWAARRD